MQKWTDLCEVIRVERLKLRLKQSDVAKSANVNKTTISGWENGLSSPGLDRFISVLDALDLELKIVRKKETE